MGAGALHDVPLMEVEVTTKPALTLGRRRKLFDLPFEAPSDFAMTRDGERFLIDEPADDRARTTGITVAQSWFEELRRR